MNKLGIAVALVAAIFLILATSTAFERGRAVGLQGLLQADKITGRA